MGSIEQAKHYIAVAAIATDESVAGNAPQFGVRQKQRQFGQLVVSPQIGALIVFVEVIQYDHRRRFQTQLESS